MADARAESILKAVRALLSGLVTTGTNVQRGQLYEHEPTKLPALSVFMGSDTPVADYQTDLVDWELELIIESTVQVEAGYTGPEPDVDVQINEIRKEVHAAMMADYTLGLAFVIDTMPGPASRPILSGDGNLPTASQSIEYVIKYRSNRNDISA